ncbi:MFS transporter [Bradyrhizobium sp. ma5]|uniref:MFS transporter n=1 Tax=Bradyrhizobium sp. ma5 TaxID=3344828 RepID=UPI0035D4D26B
MLFFTARTSSTGHDTSRKDKCGDGRVWSIRQLLWNEHIDAAGGVYPVETLTPEPPDYAKDNVQSKNIRRKSMVDGAHPINDRGIIFDDERAGFTFEQIKVLALCGVGGAIELYEFIIFVMLTPYLSQAFFPASTPEWLRTIQTLAIFAIGYFVRPIGGIVIAMLGDTLGRKRMFSLTIVLMAIPTLLIGILPTYQQVGLVAPVLLLVCRMAQGLSLGGEIPGAVVFVAEHVPFKRMGFACSLVGAGAALGLFLGAFTIGILTSLSDPQTMASWLWRVAFVIGGAIGLIAGYVRHYVEETPVFQAMRQQGRLASRVSFTKLFVESRGQLLGGLAISFMTAAVPPVLLLYPPIYMRSVLHFDASVVQNAQTIGTIALAVGSIVGGYLTDGFGAVRTYVLYAVGLVIAAYLLVTGIQSGPQYLGVWYALVGFFGGISALGYYFIIQAFSPQVRITGLSVPYNVASAVGGALPIAVATLIQAYPLAPAHIITGFTIFAVQAVPLLWRLRLPISLS